MNLRISLLALVAAGIVSRSAPAATSATSSATATLVTAVSVAKTADLNFGQIVAGVSLGTVVLPGSASPTRSFTGGVVPGNATGMAAAAFSVTGQANASYAITLPGSSTITFSANTMTVNTFTSTPSATGTLSSGGTQTLYVGGTLNAAANQVQGIYTGTFNVTVAYN